MNSMAFTMPACNTANRLLLLLLSLFALPSQAEPQFSIQNPLITQVDQHYLLNAHIDYPLTPRVVEALENGVPITFAQHFELSRPYPFISAILPWQNTLWSTTLTYQLRYHALSQQYLLLALDTRQQRNFHSRETALSALGKIENFNLPIEEQFDPETTVLRLKSEINIHALPTPMRPGALISAKWQIGSPWVEASWL